MSTEKEAAAETGGNSKRTSAKLGEYIKNPNSGISLDDLHEESGPFDKTHNRISRRDALGSFDEYQEKLSGGQYGDKVTEVKDIAEELDELKNLKNEFEEGGRASKDMQRQIERAERSIKTKAKGALRGIEKLQSANQKVIEEVSKEYAGLQRDVVKFEREAINDAKARAGAGDEAKKTFEAEKELIRDRASEVRESLKEARAERLEHSREMSQNIESVVKDIETATGKSSAEILGRTLGETKAATTEATKTVEGWFRHDKAKGFGETITKEGKQIGNLKKLPAALAASAVALGGLWATGAFKSKHPEFEPGAARSA